MLSTETVNRGGLTFWSETPNLKKGKRWCLASHS